MATYLGNYRELIERFLDAGYRTVGFLEQQAPTEELILRHDIDFDCGLAHEMARIEAELSVRATYFFMLRSDSYNLLSSSNAAHVEAIQALGHTVSLHFDPTIYDDFVAGLERERTVFEASFATPVEIVSIHRPTDFFLRFDQPIGTIAHSYQSRFSRDISYISDSQGRFRYGHPLESPAFANRSSIHLLIHPIWWMVPNPQSAIGLLRDFLDLRHSAYQNHMAQNCLPYRDFLAAQP